MSIARAFNSATCKFAFAFAFSIISSTLSLPSFGKDAGWIEADQTKFNAEQKRRQDLIQQQQQAPNYSPYFPHSVNNPQQHLYPQTPQHHQPPSQSMQFSEEVEVRSKGKSHQGVAHKAASVPMSVAGAIAGVTVGVPVKVSKSIGHYSKNMNRSMNDGLDVNEKEIDLAGRGISALCSYPFGIVSGMIHGTIKGVERGIEAGSKKPFSKESFSLTDPNNQTK